MGTVHESFAPHQLLTSYQHTPFMASMPNHLLSSDRTKCISLPHNFLREKSNFQ